MKNKFNAAFGDMGGLVLIGETITAEVEGLTVIARIEADDDQASPAQRDSGFWPSLDKEKYGYIGDGKTQSDLAAAHIYAENVIEAWRNDEWQYVGVVLAVSKNGIRFADHAASLWGIECNYPPLPGKKIDNSYLTTVANELLPEATATAKEILKKLAA